MLVKVAGYDFEGPHYSIETIEEKAGVYAVLCDLTGEQVYEPLSDYPVVDVGESGNVKDRIENHDRRDCWEEHCGGLIIYAVFYMSDATEEARRLIEANIRSKLRLPCGSD